MDEELEFYTDLALQETERWIQVVTKKRFKDPDDPRKSLEDGILLCELLNTLKAGCIRKINKLPTPIAGLDNLHVFLEKCKEDFNLNSSQLFSISDLEDLSTRAIAEFEERLRQESERRLRNVAITIYWLGRSVAPWYDGPKLDLSSFTDLVSHPGIQRGSARSTPQRSRQSSISSVTQVPQQRSRQSSVSSVTQTSQPQHTREESNDSLDHSSAYGSFRSEPKHSQSSETAEEASNSRDNSCDSVLSEDRSSCGQSLPDEKLGDYEPELVDMPGRYDHQRTGPSPEPRYSATFDSLYDNRRSSPMGRTGQDHYRSSPSLDRSGCREEYDLFRFADDTDGYGRTTSNENLSGRTSGDFLPPTRVASIRTAAPAANPLQFIKTDGSRLSHEAKEVMEVMEKQKEVKKVVQHEEEDWQSKLGDWKSRRKSAGTYIRAQELEETNRKEEEEEKQRRKSKTYKEMMEQREIRRKSTGILSTYPVDDEDDVFSKSYKTSNQAKAKDDEENRNSFGSTQPAATSAKTNSHEPSYGSSEKGMKSAGGADDDEEIAPWAKEDNQAKKDSKHQETELRDSPYKTNTSVQQRIAEDEEPFPYKSREKSRSPEKTTDIYNTSYSARVYNRDSHSRSPDRPGFSAKRDLFEAKSTEESAKRDYSIPAYSASKMDNGFHREQRDRWRESEIERQRERELERKKQIEDARKKEFEREKKRELERQQEIERRERELEKQRKAQEEFERKEELRRDRMEREAERQMEEEKQRLAARAKWEADNGEDRWGNRGRGDTKVQQRNEDQRYADYIEKSVRISQKPNNPKGFGFAIKGGKEYDMPIYVDKVTLDLSEGSAADVCELMVGDEIVSINGAEVGSHYQDSVTHVIKQSVQVGHIDLRIRRSLARLFSPDGKVKAKEQDLADSDMTYNSYAGSAPTLDEQHADVDRRSPDYQQQPVENRRPESPPRGDFVDNEPDSDLHESENEFGNTEPADDLIKQYQQQLEDQEEQEQGVEETDDSSHDQSMEAPPEPNWSTFPGQAPPTANQSDNHPDPFHDEVFSAETVKPTESAPSSRDQTNGEPKDDRNSTTEIRAEILRRKSEFLGLNVEETEEYQKIKDERERADKEKEMKETKEREISEWQKLETHSTASDPADVTYTAQEKNADLWEQVESPSKVFEDRYSEDQWHRRHDYKEQGDIDHQEREIIESIEREEREQQRDFERRRREQDQARQKKLEQERLASERQQRQREEQIAEERQKRLEHERLEWERKKEEREREERRRREEDNLAWEKRRSEQEEMAQKQRVSVAGDKMRAWKSMEMLKPGLKPVEIDPVARASRDMESLLEAQPRPKMRSSLRFFEVDDEKTRMQLWNEEQERKRQEQFQKEQGDLKKAYDEKMQNVQKADEEKRKQEQKLLEKEYARQREWEQMRKRQEEENKKLWQENERKMKEQKLKEKQAPWTASRPGQWRIEVDILKEQIRREEEESAINRRESERLKQEKGKARRDQLQKDRDEQIEQERLQQEEVQAQLLKEKEEKLKLMEENLKREAEALRLEKERLVKEKEQAHKMWNLKPDSPQNKYSPPVRGSKADTTSGYTTGEIKMQYVDKVVPEKVDLEYVYNAENSPPERLDSSPPYQIERKTEPEKTITLQEARYVERTVQKSYVKKEPPIPAKRSIKSELNSQGRDPTLGSYRVPPQPAERNVQTRPGTDEMIVTRPVVTKMTESKPGQPPIESGMSREEIMRMNRHPGGTKTYGDDYWSDDKRNQYYSHQQPPVKDPNTGVTVIPVYHETQRPQLSPSQPMDRSTLHSLSALPKKRSMPENSWIVPEDQRRKDEQQRRAQSRRSDIMRPNISHSSQHWLVEEAERRRRAEQDGKERPQSLHYRQDPYEQHTFQQSPGQQHYQDHYVTSQSAATSYSVQQRSYGSPSQPDPSKPHSDPYRSPPQSSPSVKRHDVPPDSLPYREPSQYSYSLGTPGTQPQRSPTYRHSYQGNKQTVPIVYGPPLSQLSPQRHRMSVPEPVRPIPSDRGSAKQGPPSPQYAYPHSVSMSTFSPTAQPQYKQANPSSLSRSVDQLFAYNQNVPYAGTTGVNNSHSGAYQGRPLGNTGWGSSYLGETRTDYNKNVSYSGFGQTPMSQPFHDRGDSQGSAGSSERAPPVPPKPPRLLSSSSDESHPEQVTGDLQRCGACDRDIGIKYSRV